jgi:hypothetical protein
VALALVSSGCAGLLDLDVHYRDASADGASASDLRDAGGDAPDADARAPDGSVHDAAGDAAPKVSDSGDAADLDGSDGEAPDAAHGIQFVQAFAGQGLPGAATATLGFALPVKAHDTIVVAADFDSLGTLQVTDSLGNAYQSALSPSTSAIACSIAYALDVQGGMDTVHLQLSVPPQNFFEIYIHEYSGVASLDGASAQNGTALLMESGYVTTSAPADLLFGFAVTGTAMAGSGFTARSTFNMNLTEDELTGPPGAYEATGTMVAGGGWTMLTAAFRGP